MLGSHRVAISTRCLVVAALSTHRLSSPCSLTRSQAVRGTHICALRAGGGRQRQHSTRVCRHGQAAAARCWPRQQVQVLWPPDADEVYAARQAARAGRSAGRSSAGTAHPATRTRAHSLVLGRGTLQGPARRWMCRSRRSRSRRSGRSEAPGRAAAWWQRPTRGPAPRSAACPSPAWRRRRRHRRQARGSSCSGSALRPVCCGDVGLKGTRAWCMSYA